jgi:hypothetical protein
MTRRKQMAKRQRVGSALEAIAVESEVKEEEEQEGGGSLWQPGTTDYIACYRQLQVLRQRRVQPFPVDETLDLLREMRSIRVRNRDEDFTPTPPPPRRLTPMDRLFILQQRGDRVASLAHARDLLVLKQAQDDELRDRAREYEQSPARRTAIVLITSHGGIVTRGMGMPATVSSRRLTVLRVTPVKPGRPNYLNANDESELVRITRMVMDGLKKEGEPITPVDFFHAITPALHNLMDHILHSVSVPADLVAEYTGLKAMLYPRGADILEKKYMYSDLDAITGLVNYVNLFQEDGGMVSLLPAPGVITTSAIMDRVADMGYDALCLLDFSCAGVSAAAEDEDNEDLINPLIMRYKYEREFMMG